MIFLDELEYLSDDLIDELLVTNKSLTKENLLLFRKDGFKYNRNRSSFCTDSKFQGVNNEKEN